ncbi:hypothetical protein PF003_g37488 [Phytophthora fragariae]|nr:hypothetical protein PF003_g37488 [Phytophthora fragariae]
MPSCVIVGSGLPVSFSGDAAEYATWIFNCTPTYANKSNKSQLKMLTGPQPRRSDIVVFGSKYTVFRDPGKRSQVKGALTAYVIGRDASTESLNVYISSEHKAIATRHVQNLESLKSGETDQCFQIRWCPRLWIVNPLHQMDQLGGG